MQTLLQHVHIHVPLRKDAGELNQSTCCFTLWSFFVEYVMHRRDHVAAADHVQMQGQGLALGVPPRDLKWHLHSALQVVWREGGQCSVITDTCRGKRTVTRLRPAAALNQPQARHHPHPPCPCSIPCFLTCLGGQQPAPPPHPRLLSAPKQA